MVFSQWRAYHLPLRRPGLTYSSVLPQMLAEILAQPEGAFPRSEIMTLGVGGGTITQPQIDEAKRRITPHLVNGLIATESYRIAMTPLNTPDDHRWHILEPTTVVELVDEFDQPVPIGQIGRLRVGTEGGPTSYLGDEEATKAFFRDGFFYPGDLAVRREDGRMALQGRTTDVINIHGAKIAPAPIEDRMREALGGAGASASSPCRTRMERRRRMSPSRRDRRWTRLSWSRFCSRSCRASPARTSTMWLRCRATPLASSSAAN